MERERWGSYQLALCSFMHNFMYTECYLKKTTKRLQPSQIMRQKPREFLYLTITSTLTRSRKRPHGFQVLLKKRKKKVREAKYECLNRMGIHFVCIKPPRQSEQYPSRSTYCYKKSVSDKQPVSEYIVSHRQQTYSPFS